MIGGLNATFGLLLNTLIGSILSSNSSFGVVDLAGRCTGLPRPGVLAPLVFPLPLTISAVVSCSLGRSKEDDVGESMRLNFGFDAFGGGEEGFWAKEWRVLGR